MEASAHLRKNLMEFYHIKNFARKRKTACRLDLVPCLTEDHDLEALQSFEAEKEQKQADKKIEQTEKPTKEIKAIRN